MILDEVIERYTSNAEYERTHGNLQGCLEFRQLTEWLKDYKRLLEKGPCEDAISREETLTAFADYVGSGMSMNDYDALWDIVEKMPSVNQQEPKTGHWILQPSNKDQGERDFIWWKCSKCGQVIYSETEKDRREYHAFCGKCGARMVEPKERSDKE